MSAERSSDVKFEIGHVLFIDIVIFPVVFAMHLSRSLRSRESAHVVRKKSGSKVYPGRARSSPAEITLVSRLKALPDISQWLLPD
jgi:hypothetical protein